MMVMVMVVATVVVTCAAVFLIRRGKSELQNEDCETMAQSLQIDEDEFLECFLEHFYGTTRRRRNHAETVIVRHDYAAGSQRFRNDGTIG